MEESSSGGLGSPELEDGGNGKKRKYCGLVSSSPSDASLKEDSPLSSLFSAYASSSVAHPGRTLKILTQPELQHRARYQTEGSRGSVKDREGSGFPTLQLKGYNGPESRLRLQVFIGSDTGRPVYPHVYYQACKVAGKNSTPSSETRQEGTDVILMDMEQEKDYIVRCDCVGILKERYSDIENKIPSQKQRTNWKKKSTKCRMVFRVEIPEEDGSRETLQVVSDPISCSQQPGTPEILKMSCEVAPLSGGGELWMIGKNFLKDAVVVFQENLSPPEALHRTPWMQIIPPDKDFFNNSHMIVTIPPFTLGPGSDYPLSPSIDVSVFVKCGEKTSDSHAFTYRSKDVVSKDNNTTQDSSTCSSPKCVSPIRSNRSYHHPSSRITILEPVETRYLTKEEIDYCEDTVFDPEKTQDDIPVSSGLYRQSHPAEESNSLSFSNTATTTLNNLNNTTTTATNNPLPEEDSPSDHHRHHRVTTFSNLFQKQEKPALAVEPSPGVMVIPKISSDTLKAAQKELLKKVGDVPVESKILVNGNSNGNITTNSSNEFMGTNLESKSGTNGPIYIQGTESDNATISIKLPNSIISNSEKFENVMNTINKALLQPDPSLKSIDSNLARVDISRNSVLPPPTPSGPAEIQSTASSPSNNGVVVGSVGESSELHPKKQKINDVVAPSNSDWLETWNTSSAASSRKELAKGHTPMDTSPFFTPQGAPESSWSSEPPGGGDHPKSAAINLSTILPERNSVENWNSVKVEAENWSKTAPTTWSSSVAAANDSSWHSPAAVATTVAVSQNWSSTVPATNNSKSWSEGTVVASETWQHAGGDNGDLVIAAAAVANSVPSSANEVVWQTKAPETPANAVSEPPAPPANSWQEKGDESVIVTATSWSDSKKDVPEANTSPDWFTESGKINTLWNEDWASGPKTGDATGAVVEGSTSAWSSDSPTEASNTTGGGGESNWGVSVGSTNGISDKKDMADLVVAPFISSEMTPIDPKKVMYDPSPMEVDGVYTKSKLDFKANDIPPNGSSPGVGNGGSNATTSIKGNPLLSESSAIISQQHKIESAIIDSGKVSGFHHPIKYHQSSNEGLFHLFSNSSASSDGPK